MAICRGARTTWHEFGAFRRQLTYERYDAVKRVVSVTRPDATTRLFSWDAGTYEFKAEPVESVAEAITPLPV